MITESAVGCPTCGVVFKVRYVLNENNGRLENPSLSDASGVHSVNLSALDHGRLAIYHGMLPIAVTAPPISTIAGTTVMITPQQRYEFRLDFGKRISHLTLTERGALELIQRLRQSIATARKAQQVAP